MIREVKVLDLEPIKARARGARNSLRYPAETIRANYLNDVPTLLAEVERLREEKRLLKQINEEALGVHRRVAELRAKIDREATLFCVEAEEHEEGRSRL